MPAVPPGYIRLYRSEDGGTANVHIVGASPEARRLLAGRWYTSELARAERFGRIYYVDVPIAQAEQYRLPNLINTEPGVAEFNPIPSPEVYVIPRAIADTRLPLVGSDVVLPSMPTARPSPVAATGSPVLVLPLGAIAPQFGRPGSYPSLPRSLPPMPATMTPGMNEIGLTPRARVGDTVVVARPYETAESKVRRAMPVPIHYVVRP